jgi:hypothetical protein
MMDLFTQLDEVGGLWESPLTVVEHATLGDESRRADELIRLQRRGGPRRRRSVSASIALMRLVMDGVVALEENGKPVWGAMAPASVGLAPDRLAKWARTTPPTDLALHHGERLLPLPVDDLAFSLYRYGTHPLTPRLAARYSAPDALRRALGVDATIDRRARAAGWVLSGLDSSGRWIYWTRRVDSSRISAPLYKLFVSVPPEELAPALQASARAAMRHHASAFKVGADLAGILRPDKLVLYFRRNVNLRAAAAELAGSLTGLRGNGIPFAAPIGDCGLLAWGVDSNHLAARSWRATISQCLARSLVVAHATARDRSVILPFALARLSLEGIDPVTMTPAICRRRRSA